jgi:hypothetical protein
MAMMAGNRLGKGPSSLNRFRARHAIDFFCDGTAHGFPLETLTVGMEATLVASFR